MKTNNKSGVFAALRMAARAHYPLTIGTLLCVAASVIASLLPPLLLARIIDGLAAGLPLTIWAVLIYFASLALEGVLSSAQESLLVLFGQKMTHALRSEMSHKLTQLPARTLVDQNPGEVAARFSGDVDTVEALFTSGIISMVADACRILSIMAVIAAKNPGLALILLLVLPLFAVFTRRVQRRMLAAQLDNRRAVAAVSGQVPETLHNIRTIRALGMEQYMERRYDRCIGAGYAAMERTNFYDAVYSPVVLLLNAVVVGIVMLLSASGNAVVLELFGMSVGTSVAVINYISRIFAPIESLGMEVQTIQSAMAGVKRIDAFLAQPEREISAQRTRAARGDVELSHVTFGYGEKHVLNDFSMTVKQGEQVTLIGRTGAGIPKASRRDLPVLVAQGKDGACTVTTTMMIADMAGIRVFATGGIGGVHRGAQETFDISADLEELANTSVMVVCAGAKSILDLGLTLEYLETHGVTVIGYGTSELPAFYTRKSGFGVDYELDTPEQLAKAFHVKRELGLRGGLLVTNPIPEEYSMDKEVIDKAIAEAVEDAKKDGIHGKATTPYLLAKIKDLTGGDSLDSNIQLVFNNARLGAAAAVELSKLEK